MSGAPVARGAGRRPLRSWLLVAFVSILSACSVTRSAGRSLANGTIEGVVSQESTLVALQGRLADSAGVYLGREFREAVITPARATWDTMARQVGSAADSSAVRLAAGIRGPVDEAVEQLLERSFDVIEARTDRLARMLPSAATPGLERSLATSFGVVGDTLAHHLSAGLAEGLEEQLRPALHALMRDLSDSLRVRVGELDRTVAESSTVGGVRSFLVGSAAALVLAALLAMLLSWRRHRRALDAMLDAVRLADDPKLHDAVRGCAGEAGIEGWLAGRAAARRREECR